jgi:hypothetical protein
MQVAEAIESFGKNMKGLRVALYMVVNLMVLNFNN